jgi:all-trans-8'-apo-beta-carotenal 15,15'-oxygenase
MAPTLNRRTWMERISAMSLLSLAGIPSMATTQTNIWRHNYAPFDAPDFKGHLQAHSLTYTGHPPAKLKGFFYRNGPARFARGATRLNHWFDGDGMIQSFSINGKNVSHLGRMLKTSKSEMEQKHNRFLYNGFGSKLDHVIALNRPDDMNPSNINLLAMNEGKNLFALWEAGSALEIDPQTLKTIGYKTWSPETAGAPFSAHPKTAADGSIWSYGHLSGSGSLLLYHIDSHGKLLRQHLLKLPQADMVHDFAITDKYLIFLLQPLFSDTTQANYPNILSSLRWDQNAPMLLCIINKSDFETLMIELPNSGVFHLGNAWEEGYTIRLNYVHHHNILDTLHSFDFANDFNSDAATWTQWRELVIDLQQRRADVHETDIRGVEFPRIDTRLTGKNNRLTVMLRRSPTIHAQAGIGFNQVLVLNKQHSQSFSYGHEWLAEEHILVPHPDIEAEDAGWILGTAYHWPSAITTLSVFAASAVSDGPLAQWRLPYGLPLGLHGQFVPMH